MSRRTTPLLTALPLLAAACTSSTEPRRDFDISRFPWIVSPAGVRVYGTSRVLVIPARFRDGSPPPLTSSAIAGQLFASANGGPVNESYSLASGGVFSLKGRVTSWVTTSLTAAQLSLPGVLTPSGTEDYVWEALELVEGEVDFGLFDNEGPDGLPNSGDDDGVVDGGVVILNSERNRYCDGGTGVGPHPFARTQWTVNGQRYRTADVGARGGFIEVGGFTLMSATGCGGSNVAAHIMAHELGHLLFRLPDLYHNLGGAGEVWATRRWIVGCWDLMAASAWGCRLSADPAMPESRKPKW